MATPEPNLSTAADNVYNDMYITHYLAGTIKTNLTGFYQALTTTFKDGTPLDRPCANWVAIIAAYTDKLVDTVPPLDQFNVLVQMVWRFLLLTRQMALVVSGSSQITAAQATAVLNAFNANF